MYVHNMNTFTEVFKDLTRYTHKDLKFLDSQNYYVGRSNF